jgi:hypothetical protein
MCSDRIMWPPASNFDTVVYFSAIDSIAGDVLPLSCFKKNLISIFYGSKDSGWCFPAIESIAGVHIVEFYRSRDVFSRYRIYHFEDFICILPLSIDSGKTHQKSPANSPVFGGFFAKYVWQIFKTGCTITYPHPHPVHYTNMFCRFMLFRPSFTNTEGG